MKSILAYNFLETVPHNPINKNIGINTLSNKQKKDKRSKTRNVSNKKNNSKSNK